MFFGKRHIYNRLLDKTEIRSSVKQTTSAKGAVFYATFRVTVDGYLVTVAKEFVPLLMKHTTQDASLVGSVLIGLLDHVSRDKQLRKK